jgi:hypothetical protein
MPPTEDNWSNNNLAHVFTNLALVSLKQYKARPFPKVGAIKVKELAFFPAPGSTANVKNVAAKSMAAMIDGIMNQWVENAQYEKGFNPIKSINTIAVPLADGDKTVADVGNAVDEAFFFASEHHDG